MSGSAKKELKQIIIGAALFALAFAASKLFPDLPWYATALIFLVPYLVAGGEVLLEAAHGIRNGQLLDENFLMSVASLGAFAIGEQPEAVLVMLLYRLGELLQCPESVNLETENGVDEVSPEEVQIGDIFVVRAGERVSLDGTVVEGSSSVNTAALTGESLPVDVAPGDAVISGSINTSGVLRVRADREYADSTAARMLDLIEGAAANKSKSEKFRRTYRSISTITGDGKNNGVKSL